MTQPEGSHVHWPRGYEDVDSWTETHHADLLPANSIHHMSGSKRGASSSWSIRFPNDKFVQDEASTLEEMRLKGAV